MNVKDLIDLDEHDFIDNEVLRSEFSELDEGQWSFMQSIILCKKDPRPFEDFYIFENVITGLNFEEPDFGNLDPPSAEQLWHGIKLMHMLVPKMKFGFEVKIYAKRIFNERGVYFYPEEIDDDPESLKKVVDKANNGPFPLKSDDLIDIQASHFLALDMYHQMEMGKDISFLDKEIDI